MLGGASVSGAPELYPEFDYLHIGEIGDGTDRLIACLDAGVAAPPAQVQFETKERLPLCDFPVPAYDLVSLDRYLIGSLQFSSGCPYRCEFCDIPALYGRQPRLKTPQQITAELDAMLARRGHPPVVYFVDDNFIGNRKAAREMLPHLIAWQRKHGYPLQFACEATLNLAKQTEILSLMREAHFITVFVGIETPEVDALKAMRKEQNAALPMLEAIRTLNSYGLEVTSGIILGLDTDTADTESRLKAFIDLSQVPILTINLLQALPRTPLWDRLKRDDRLIADDTGLESNVRFLRPYDEVVATWLRCIAYAYDPERLFARFAHQVETTYVNRMIGPVRGKLTINNLRGALVLAFNVAFRVGLFADYRRSFWRAARRALRRGQIDAVLRHGFRRPSSHPVLARGAARRPERLILFCARSRPDGCARPRSGALAAPVSLTELVARMLRPTAIGCGSRLVAHGSKARGRTCGGPAMLCRGRFCFGRRGRGSISAGSRGYSRRAFASRRSMKSTASVKEA